MFSILNTVTFVFLVAKLLYNLFCLSVLNAIWEMGLQYVAAINARPLIILVNITNIMTVRLL